MTTSFLSKDELTKIGFKKIGKNVFLSRKASIYGPENMEIGNNVRIDDFWLLNREISSSKYMHIYFCSNIFGDIIKEKICESVLVKDIPKK